jgi:hypothetical protein
MMMGRMGRIPMLGRTGAEPIGAASRHAEKGTLVGLLAGIGMLAAAIALGGSAKSFVDLPSLLIVVGGTLAVIVICFSSEEVQTMLCVVGGTLSSAPPDPTAAAVRAPEFAEQARQHGLLRLELLLDQHVDSPFLRKAMCMVVDGTAIAELEEVLRNDIQATLHRLRRSAAVLRRAADYAPRRLLRRRHHRRTHVSHRRLRVRQGRVPSGCRGGHAHRRQHGDRRARTSGPTARCCAPASRS